MNLIEHLSTLTMLVPVCLFTHFQLSRAEPVKDLPSAKLQSFRMACFMILLAGEAHVLVNLLEMFGVKLPGFHSLTKLGMDHLFGHAVAVPLMQIGLLLAYHTISRIYPDLDLLSHAFLAVHLIRSSILLIFHNYPEKFIDWNNFGGSKILNAKFEGKVGPIEIKPSHPLALLYSGWPAIWIGMQIAGRLLQEHMSGVAAPTLMNQQFLRNVAIVAMLAEIGSLMCMLNVDPGNGGIGLPENLELLLERGREVTYILLAGIAWSSLGTLDSFKSMFPEQRVEGMNSNGEVNWDIRHAQFPWTMLPAPWRERMLGTPAPPSTGIIGLVTGGIGGGGQAPVSETSVQNRASRRQQELAQKKKER